jgi:hypothetical protein
VDIDSYPLQEQITVDAFSADECGNDDLLPVKGNGIYRSLNVILRLVFAATMIYYCGMIFDAWENLEINFQIDMKQIKLLMHPPLPPQVPFPQKSARVLSSKEHDLKVLEQLVEDALGPNTHYTNKIAPDGTIHSIGRSREMAEGTSPLTTSEWMRELQEAVEDEELKLSMQSLFKQQQEMMEMYKKETEEKMISEDTKTATTTTTASSSSGNNNNNNKRGTRKHTSKLMY